MSESESTTNTTPKACKFVEQMVRFDEETQFGLFKYCSILLVRWSKIQYGIVKYNFFYEIAIFFTFSNHCCTVASDGIRRSPRGDTATEPIFGESGKHDRLNCDEKNL